MIPIFVNVFNRLTTTRILCEQIARLDNATPIIVDNASTWEPLLDWYETEPFPLIRLQENLGHHAPWISGVVNGLVSDIYGVSDCDLDLDGIPEDLIDVLIEPLEWGSPVVKSGVSLRIDDVPEWNQGIVTWEERWWRRPVREGRYFLACVDTTLALYRSGTPHATCCSVVNVAATRSAPPYCARHTPWYLDCDNLDAENANYFATAGRSNSWKPRGRGLAAPYAH